MPQSDNQVEANEPMDDAALDAQIDAALTSAGADPNAMAIKSAAAAEEQAQVARLREIAAQQEPPEEISLASVMAKGREALHQQMRDHIARTEAKKNSYVPPPRTARQQEALEVELAAGRRAQEKHQAQADARPPRPADPMDGTSTPVHRPNNVVPDPTKLAPSGFVAGNRVYGPNA